MRGKYSPTVSAAYANDQHWFERYCGGSWLYRDPEGYDSYGYDVDGIDRAGNRETAYALGSWVGTEYVDENELYTQTLEDWWFDGTKPARRENVDNKWFKRADEMVQVEVPTNSPDVVCGQPTQPKAKKKRETKLERQVREAEEREARLNQEKADYPALLMTTLERACELNHELVVRDGNYVVQDRDARGLTYSFTPAHTHLSQEAIHDIVWRMDLKEAAEREAERKIQLKQSALAKLSKEEIDALMEK